MTPPPTSSHSSPEASTPTRGSSAPTLTRDDDQRMRALVTRAQDGDREAFAEIYDASVDGIYRYLLYRTKSATLAEDLTSETFIRALRNIDKFRWEGRDIAAWLTTIARNLALDYFKSSAHRMETTTDDFGWADHPDEGLEATVLDRLDTHNLHLALIRLKPEQRECLTLRFLQELSVTETASVMQRSEGAIKQLQLRAVRSLSRLLSDDNPYDQQEPPDREGACREDSIERTQKVHIRHLPPLTWRGNAGRKDS